jgi:hypothetical protein
MSSQVSDHNSLDKIKDRSFSIDSLKYSEESTNSPIDKKIFSKELISLENTLNLSEHLCVDKELFSFVNTPENTEMNRNFSGDSSLFSGVLTKENTENNLNYRLFLEKPLNEEENSSLYTHKFSYKSPKEILISSDNMLDEFIDSSLMSNKRLKLSKCKGCYPIFQPNQEGHIGENGCLEDYNDIFMN